MKKFIVALLALTLALMLFVSCGEGASIAIGALRLDNEVKNLFKFTDTVSYYETVTYTDAAGAPIFSASYYYEKAEDIYAGYNVIETIGDYRLYAYEGAVYTETPVGITAVLLLSGTYQNFVETYLEGNFLLDGDTLFQRGGKTENGITYAEYESTLTPQQIARASELGIKENDKIISTYAVRDSRIESVSYKVERNGEQFSIAKREIRVSTATSPERFSAVSGLEKAISVDLVFVNSETKGRHFDIPQGVYIGMETGAHDYTFYLDAECSQVYSFGLEPITDALTLYVVEN